jgi:DNA polymerase-1
MPDELGGQIAPLKEAIVAMGWPLIEVPGVEADDVIGTLTREAGSADMRTVISTGDKDMAQLVTPHVRLVNTMSNEVLDETGVEKKFGVRPERFVDYLTLIGDSIDNVPGVDKVGPKTAVKWLSQYGSLDAVIARADEIGGLAGENLRKVRDWLPKARNLLTIKCDVALPEKVADLAPRVPDARKLAELFERFELKALQREFEGGGTAGEGAGKGIEGRGPGVEGGGPGVDGRGKSEETGVSHAELTAPLTQETRTYETILTEAQLEAWVGKLMRADLAALAIETTSLDPMRARIVGLSFAIETGEAAYVPVAHRYAGCPEQLSVQHVLERLKPWLQDRDRPKVGRNVKYDTHVFANHGIDLQGVQHDTVLQSLPPGKPPAARHGESRRAASLAQNAFLRRGDGEGGGAHSIRAGRGGARDGVRRRGYRRDASAALCPVPADRAPGEAEPCLPGNRGAGFPRAVRDGAPRGAARRRSAARAFP